MQWLWRIACGCSLWALAFFCLCLNYPQYISASGNSWKMSAWCYHELLSQAVGSAPPPELWLHLTQPLLLLLPLALGGCSFQLRYRFLPWPHCCCTGPAWPATFHLAWLIHSMSGLSGQGWVRLNPEPGSMLISHMGASGLWLGRLRAPSISIFSASMDSTNC